MTAIEETATVLQREDRGIQNAMMVCKKVKDTYDLDVTEKLVRQVMRERCKFSFIKTKKMTPGSNSLKSILARQTYAMRILLCCKKAPGSSTLTRLG